ncbi:hybrid sensor histidine kinase/response regulator [Pirellulimonas nuda]|uniref:hybrid sensor histidine kinase/response regulator n=1 Tax=Pirellulimonas nuda TaxID=2528009 RepID=UPI001E521B6A|nr:response regulator [Pirellulimonas nuda]
MSEPTATQEAEPAASPPAAPPPPSGRKVLCLSGPNDGDADLVRRLGEGVEVVTVSSPVRALACLARGEFTGIYADAAHFAQAADAGRLVQNEQILQAMPDGVVLLSADNTVLWGNGRLKQWSNVDQVIGRNFYQILDNPEILGPEFCPFSTALANRQASASTLRCEDGRHFRVHAAPVFEGDQPPQHLVVTIRDVTQEVQQQQKLAAIHQAGIELADLTTDEVAALTVDERIELLKSNILHFTKDVLHYDVIEVRMLEQSTGELMPLLAVGIKPEAERRKLYAEAEGNGVTGFVAATGQSYICGDTSGDPIYIEGAQDARSSLTVPLLLHDQVFGTFNVESPDPGAFGEGDLQFLELFCRDLAVAINTLDLLAAEKATTAAASVEAIHSAVAVPVDEILNDAVGVMERYIGHEPDVVERLHRVLRNARDIKQVIQKIGQTMAPVEARPQCVRIEPRPALVGKHILVVDADDTVRGAAHSLLERYHCNVETAHDGKEAIAMFRSFSQPGAQGGQYDAVIADIRMPDMNGYELMLELQKFTPHVPLILMTGFGYDPGHSIVKARQAGLKEVLYKPFRLDQLLETVERQIDESQAEPGQNA